MTSYISRFLKVIDVKELITILQPVFEFREQVEFKISKISNLSCEVFL